MPNLRPTKPPNWLCTQIQPASSVRRDMRTKGCRLKIQCAGRQIGILLPAR
jgi:hypothetical protein